MFNRAVLSPDDVVKWLSEPSTDGREEVRAIPRDTLKGVFSGHSVESARTIELINDSLAIALVGFQRWLVQ